MPPGLPQLAPPQSWGDDEGTAALLLPPAEDVQPPPARASLPRPHKHADRTPVRPRWGRTLFPAAGIGLLLLLGLFLLTRQWMPAPANAPRSDAPLTAHQQQLLDGAAEAMARGQIDRSIELLQRFQREQPPAGDPAIERLIVSLKRQPASRP